MAQFLIVGLGNPDKAGTRHNFGIDTVKLFVERQQEQGRLRSDWQSEEKFSAEIASVTVQGQEVVCLFPTTFMNESGRAVAAYVNFFKLPFEQVLLVHDELELPLGAVESIPGGSAHGHNGVRSIHEVLGIQTIPRLRLGIGRPADTTPVDEYVLASFTGAEQVAVTQAAAAGADQILNFIVRLTQG